MQCTRCAGKCLCSVQDVQVNVCILYEMCWCLYSIQMYFVVVKVSVCRHLALFYLHWCIVVKVSVCRHLALFYLHWCIVGRLLCVNP